MNTREKVLVGAAVLVVVLFGVPMTLEAMGSGANTEVKLAGMASTRREKETQAKTLESQVKVLRPQVEALSWNVSPDLLRQTLVKRVSGIAQSAKVTLSTTRPLKPRSLDVMTEVSVEMHLSSTLPQLVRFLYPLQEPGSKLSVDRLRISSANSESDLLDVDMTVSGYTLQVPAEAKAAVVRSQT